MAFGALRSLSATASQEVSSLKPLSASLSRWGLAFLAAGLGFSLVWPERLAGAVLLASLFALSVGVGATFFVALHSAVAAHWGVVVRRVAEALAVTTIWVAPVFFLALLVVGPGLYPWVHHAEVGFRGLWLSWPFFLARASLYLGAWVFFARRLVILSLRQDESPSLETAALLRKTSVAFLPVFAVSFSLASFDWLMSLAPEFVSTIFGVYVFSGTFVAALAGLTWLVTVLLQRGPRGVGPLAPYVNANHLHDLGKLLFAFSTFWAYIWFSQYMLIWYANLPEEASYFVERLAGFWQPLFILNLFLNWVLPFFALLPRASKRSPKALAMVSLVLLVGHALDLYLMVGPSWHWQALPSPVEVLLLAGAASLVLAAALGFLRRVPVVPLGDPFLDASRHHRG
ncbi:hypothetical protein HRbin09_00296 [bacterium HR09]|nr:hypothetical protein HRbin09_00296 [bacterium HR09]